MKVRIRNRCEGVIVRFPLAPVPWSSFQAVVYDYVLRKDKCISVSSLHTTRRVLLAVMKEHFLHARGVLLVTR